MKMTGYSLSGYSVSASTVFHIPLASPPTDWIIMVLCAEFGYFSDTELSDVSLTNEASKIISLCPNKTYKQGYNIEGNTFDIKTTDTQITFDMNGYSSSSGSYMAFNSIIFYA